MKRYETIIIFDSLATDEQINAEVERYKKLLADNNAQGVSSDAWGKRELAYQMNKKTHGAYIVFYFEAAGLDSNLVDASNKHLRIVESVIKFQTHRIPDSVRKFKGRLNFSDGSDDDVMERSDRFGHDAY
jgi:small subunit ribosomal protein S6